MGGVSLSVSKKRLSFVLAIALLVTSPLSIASAEENDPEMKELDQLDKYAAEAHKFGSYQYSPTKNPERGGAMSYKLSKDGKIVFDSYKKGETDEGYKVSIIAPLKAGASKKVEKYDRLVEDVLDPFGPKLNPGTDITGDGVPDLIVCNFSGGAHCCFSYTVFSLGPQFKKLATIGGEDSQYRFKDLDGDGACEAVGHDFTFGYWNTCFADSPAPLVILSLKGGKPTISKSLMKMKAPSDSQLREMAKVLKADMAKKVEGAPKDDKNLLYPVPDLWAKMLDFIYTGNGESAWKLLNLAWPDSKQGWFMDSTEPGKPKSPTVTKASFLRDFKKQLASSPNWVGIKDLNGWK